MKILLTVVVAFDLGSGAVVCTNKSALVEHTGDLADLPQFITDEVEKMSGEITLEIEDEDGFEVIGLLSICHSIIP
ncbi:MAG: hypothetical protein Q8O98_01125 [bacterium]|nr:hypothetical protein [bacterium]